MNKSVLTYLKSWRKSETGATSVEFAMVGLGFITLLIAIIEIGRMAWTENVVDYAIDESARYAVVHEDATSADVENVAQNILQSFYVPSDVLDVTVNNVSTDGIDYIEIQGNYAFQTLSNGFLPAAISEVTLNIAVRRPLYRYAEEE